MNTRDRTTLVDALLRTAMPLSPDAASAIATETGTRSASSPAARHAHAVAVHRQTVRHALLGALRDAFPAVGVAVGDDYFSALASEFIAVQPPRSPVLQAYGDGFADFVASFPPLRDWPWLADLARVDWARREAYHAADSVPVSASYWRTLDATSLLSARLTLDPSLRLLASQHPLVSLWRAHQAEVDVPTATAVVWQPEACRIQRIDEHVQVIPLDPRTFALLQALSDGHSLLQALRLSVGDDATTDADTLAGLLRPLIDDRLIVAVHTPDTE